MIPKILARRGFLKALGAAPIGAHALAHEVGARLLDTQVGGGAFLPPSLVGHEPGQEKPTIFKSFAKWMLEHGKGQLEGACKYVNGFDPDIVSLHISLQHKVKMQRNRNYAVMLANKKIWFERSIAKKGFIEWWG